MKPCVIPRCRRTVRAPSWAICDGCFARLAKAEPMQPNGRGGGPARQMPVCRRHAAQHDRGITLYAAEVLA